MVENEFDPDEYQEQLGKTMKSLGFSVVYQKPVRLGDNECSIYYSDFGHSANTMSSDLMDSTIAIQFREQVGSKIRIKVRDMMLKLRQDFRVSGVANNMFFAFGKMIPVVDGTSYSMVIPVKLSEELND